MGSKLPVRKDIAIDGFPAMVIRLRWEGDAPTWIDFEIYEAWGSDADGRPGWFTTPKRDLGSGETTNLDEAAPDVTGFVKADGCTQLGFTGDGPPAAYNIHCDDVDGLARMMDAVKRAQAECYAIFDVTPEKP